jgi:hypothetical protein
VGVLIAAVIFEFSLRPFVADSDHLGIRTIRSYFEGLAVAHFESDGFGEIGTASRATLICPVCRKD